MNTLITLWRSVSALAANLATLAKTVRTIDAGLRERVGLDGSDPLRLPDMGSKDVEAEATDGSSRTASRRGKAKE
jgi:hypothetical protein